MTTLTILTYHRILKLTPEFTLHKEIVSCTPSMFRKQLQYLKKRYTIITFSELDTLLRTRQSLAKRLLILTFDDGYIDNYENAFPILKELGIPATFFVTTGFLDGKATPWWDSLSNALSTTRKAKVSFLGREYSLSSLRDRIHAEHEMTKLLQAMHQHGQQKAMKRLLLNLRSLDTRHLRNLFMSWKQAAEMERKGMEILPHTTTHPNLSAATLAEAQREISASCATVSKRLKKKIAAFSYPYGYSSENARRILTKLHIPFGVATVFGINTISSNTDLLELRRMDVYRTDPLWRFKLKLNPAIVAVHRRINSLP